MIEIKGNTIIITVPEETNNKKIINDIVDFANLKIKNFKSRHILDLIEDYHLINKDFKFNREETYNDIKDMNLSEKKDYYHKGLEETANIIGGKLIKNSDGSYRIEK